MNVEYKIVFNDDISEFEACVSERLKEGYKIAGSLFIKAGVYYQPMIKREKKKNKINFNIEEMSERELFDLSVEAFDRLSFTEQESLVKMFNIRLLK